MENKYSNKYIIETGMGLQEVDGLKNSTYFINESEKYVKGEITLDELEEVIASYYKNKPEEKERTEEADIVSVRIAKLILDDSFSFTVGQFISIHKQLFEGVYGHAGKLRTYNFTKKEWVLDGASVLYSDYRLIETTLQYDFEIERKFDYSHLSDNELVDHLSLFISNLWQIHAFEEGNTRTTAVFVIKYLRSLGYDVTNDAFAKNAWYFRNALVRANYRHLRKGVYEDKSFLNKFLRNLILNEDNQLHNRNLHINPIQQPIENSREAKILTLMNNNPSIKLDEIAQQLNVSLRTIKSAVAALVKDGKVERLGGKKIGSWKTKP